VARWECEARETTCDRFAAFQTLLIALCGVLHRLTRGVAIALNARQDWAGWGVEVGREELLKWGGEEGVGYKGFT